MQRKVRNVIHALRTGIHDFNHAIELDATADEPFLRTVAPRGMPTVEWPEPVLTIYEQPRERVLFDPNRDANPFLHFFEALWMLAGREDLRFMLHLSKRFMDFSDNGHTLPGAYGYRWRGGETGASEQQRRNDTDQLSRVIDLLRAEPDSRRAVITMWTAGDLKFTGAPLDVRRGRKASRDVPCNTQIFLKVRDAALDMTVTCRSNDMLWGAYGANAVHFSMLQEYLAGALSLRVGCLSQLSDSFHVYIPPHPSGALWQKVSDAARKEGAEAWCPYEMGEVQPYPMMLEGGFEDWNDDLYTFFRLYDRATYFAKPMPPDPIGSAEVLGYEPEQYKTEFFKYVVAPMWEAFQWRPGALRDVAGAVLWDKPRGSVERALEAAQVIRATDWQRAVVEWLERRRSVPLVADPAGK